MKQFTILFALIVLATSFTNAQSWKCKKQMRKALQTHFNSASTLTEWQAAADAFRPITTKFDEEWMPLYYFTLAKINGSNQTKDGTTIDAELDEAQAALDKAFKLAPKESELYVLQANIYYARIAVNYFARGMQMVTSAHSELVHAKELNPDNPRVYFLLAMSAYNTPEQFGGSKERALDLFQKAKEKFDTFKPDSRYSPRWGRAENTKMLAKFKK